MRIEGVGKRRWISVVRIGAPLGLAALLVKRTAPDFEDACSTRLALESIRPLLF